MCCNYAAGALRGRAPTPVLVSAQLMKEILNLEIKARTPVKTELYKPMLKSGLVVNKEAHDKFCGIRLTLNVARMVFDIIASSMKFDTIKVDIKTYLDSDYSGKQCVFRKVQGSGDK